MCINVAVRLFLVNNPLNVTYSNLQLVRFTIVERPSPLEHYRPLCIRKLCDNI
jgi:hypothetical protein